MASAALHDPALSGPLPSFTVTSPPGPLLVLLLLPGSLLHSIQVSVPMLLLRGAIADHRYKTVASQSLSL